MRAPAPLFCSVTSCGREPRRNTPSTFASLSPKTGRLVFVVSLFCGRGPHTDGRKVRTALPAALMPPQSCTSCSAFTPPRRWPMKRKALLLLFTAIVALAMPAHAQQYELLFAFTGFDYQDPNPVPGPNPDPGYLAVGE